jgi:hypothetical protein
VVSSGNVFRQRFREGRDPDSKRGSVLNKAFFVVASVHVKHLISSSYQMWILP